MAETGLVSRMDAAYWGHAIHIAMSGLSERPPLTYRSRQLGSLASPSPPRGIGAGGETCLARGPRPRVNIAALPCAARAIQLTYSVLLTSYHEWNFGIRIEGG